MHIFLKLSHISFLEVNTLYLFICCVGFAKLFTNKGICFYEMKSSFKKIKYEIEFSTFISFVIDAFKLSD